MLNNQKHNLKTYKVNLSDNLKMGNAKLVTSEHLCLSQLPSDIPLLATKKPRCPILNVMVFWLPYLVFWNQAVSIFLQNVFSLFFGENVGCKKVVFLKSKAILYFISFGYRWQEASIKTFCDIRNHFTSYCPTVLESRRTCICQMKGAFIRTFSESYIKI